MINLPPDLELILASQSPRRLDLLRRIGLRPHVEPAHIHEEPFTEGDPEDYAIDLAREKAQVIAQRYPKALVVGADTIVVVDRHVLGKPVDEKDAAAMLQTLANRWHIVNTAYCLTHLSRNIEVTGVEATRVHFRALSPAEIAAYIATGSPMDKAGAYGIQDGSALFVDRIEGCFYNVVGFPLAHFGQSMQRVLAQLS